MPLVQPKPITLIGEKPSGLPRKSSRPRAKNAVSPQSAINSSIPPPPPTTAKPQHQFTAAVDSVEDAARSTSLDTGKDIGIHARILEVHHHQPGFFHQPREATSSLKIKTPENEVLQK
eukprot:CAMPEP_0116841242 /NCGR_PEP_ID=MMETSP0418-20121206/10813_1 /TAXON_ID=1158023 /ORGANISM="Astrosyne radiata, Strain 13vi08-1A" /LENGTH=117 /DNA_ID=CAMNT_0004471641 /DNA_START=693 /DNA_END=1047 /DNA_ORIENTATION=-